MMSSSNDGDGESTTTAAAAATEISKAPTLNGKMVLPVKAMTGGLKGHKVAAVYAILNSSYKRGSGEGWEHVQHVSITRDLAADLSYFLTQKGPTSVSHIRALSFSYPQKATMEDFANGWRGKVQEAGGNVRMAGDGGAGWGVVPKDGAGDNGVATAAEGTSNVITVGEDYEMDDDDDDDDDDMDHEDYLEMMSGSKASASPPPPLFVDNSRSAMLGVDNAGLGNIATTSLAAPADTTEPEDIISPFETATNAASAAAQSTFDANEPLALTIENVDKVLDEVRPYLISDGGNVSVPRVDAETGNVYLLLEGACGSCASSTVTMKMGIERVLNEQFGERLGEVIQVDPEEEEGGDAKSTELTIEVVQAEVDRISQAIVAMGGVVRVVSVDPRGVVEIEYRGPNRVQKGLELALLDVEYVKHVKFVS